MCIRDRFTIYIPVKRTFFNNALVYDSGDHDVTESWIETIRNVNAKSLVVDSGVPKNLYTQEVFFGRQDGMTQPFIYLFR